MLGDGKSTAHFRKLARKYEEECEWQKALECYDKAISSYPDIPDGFELLRRDFENLKQARREVAIFLRGEVGGT